MVGPTKVLPTNDDTDAVPQIVKSIILGGGRMRAKDLVALGKVTADNAKFSLHFRRPILDAIAPDLAIFEQYTSSSC